MDNEIKTKIVKKKKNNNEESVKTLGSVGSVMLAGGKKVFSSGAKNISKKIVKETVVNKPKRGILLKIFGNKIVGIFGGTVATVGVISTVYLLNQPAVKKEVTCTASIVNQEMKYVALFDKSENTILKSNYYGKFVIPMLSKEEIEAEGKYMCEQYTEGGEFAQAEKCTYEIIGDNTLKINLVISSEAFEAANEMKEDSKVSKLQQFINYQNDLCSKDAELCKQEGYKQSCVVKEIKE